MFTVTSSVVLVLGVTNGVFADGHYAYSEQTVKKFHDPHAHSGHHGELSHIGSHKPEHHEGYAWAYPAYEFSYKVEDHHTHDYKGQHETRDGDEVKGMYWLIQPDGKKRTVTYHADKHSGFHANVEYSEPDHHVYHEKKHENHQEPKRLIQHQEHHDEYPKEHHKDHEEEQHKKYYSKPYGYNLKITHPKLHKVHKLHENHHEEDHEENHHEVHEDHHEQKHKELEKEHHIPHSNQYIHIKHIKYNGPHDNAEKYDHKEDVHDKHNIKVLENHHYQENLEELLKKHSHKYHDETYYDKNKKYIAHHLEKPHHEEIEEEHRNKYDHDYHEHYIEHKLLDELRAKAYQAFKIHELNKHKEHYENHHVHPHLYHDHHRPVYHEHHKLSHHAYPLADRKHYGYYHA